VHEAGCARGTIVEVRNLFGNVPVRKKFLKTARTELFHIEEVVRNQSLAHVHTAFSLEVEGRSVLDLPARENLKDRFFDNFRCRDYWLQVESAGPVEEGTRLHGFLQQPEAAARGNRLRILVNDRPVQDRMIRHAVIEGLHGFLMKGQSPGGVLLLEIPPEQVDVNVHPAKQEIRFRHSREVHRFIVKAVNDAIRRYQEAVRADVFAVPESRSGAGNIRKADHSPAPRRDKPASSFLFPAPAQALSGEGESYSGMQTAERAPAGVPEQSTRYRRILPEKSDGEPDEDLTGLTLVGQLFNLYLLCEKGEQLVAIDQHAAHERVIYEELRSNYLQQNVPRQHLMFPVSVELSSGQAEIMESRSDDLALLGFHAEHFGDATWVVKSVPALVSHLDTAELLHETLEGLRSVPPGESRGVVAGGIDSLLSSMACKAAVKAGNRLAPEEMLQLLANMGGTGFFSHCPHGRPVIKTFAKREIEQWFKRG